MLWEIEITAKKANDREGASLLGQARLRQLSSIQSVRAARSYIIEGMLHEGDIARAASLLSDDVVESANIRQLPANDNSECETERLVNVMFKPGVTDNVGATAANARRKFPR